MGQRKATWTRVQFAQTVTGQKQIDSSTWWIPNDGGIYIKVLSYSGMGVNVLLTPGACDC